MNESNVALAESPVDNVDDSSTSGGGDRRKLLLLVGGAAGVVLLGLAAWFLFFSGSDTSADEGPVVAGKPAATAPAPAATKAPAPAATPFTEAIGRDPFEPIIAPAAAAPAAAAPEAAASGTTSGGSTASGTSVTVEMVAVDPASATLKVDGKSYTAKVGETFATSFKLYGLFDAQCAGVLYGEQSVPLCVGDVRTLTG